MIRNTIKIDRTGTRGGESWLIRAKCSAILIDTGFPFYGHFLASEIDGFLNGLPLTDILITHSHYDHAGGLAKIKAAFPDAVSHAAAHTANILNRESALKAMRILNRTAASMAGGSFEALDEDVGEYKVDHIACDCDKIHTEDFLIEIWDTPGHTNDSLSFWFPEENLLALSESTGVFSRRPELYVEPAFIVSWKAALAAMDRIESISPYTLLIPHMGLLTGGDVPLFLKKQREEILFLKDLVIGLTAEGKTEEDILSAIQSRYYDNRPESFRNCQPLPAFLLNFKAMIPRTLKEANDIHSRAKAFK